MTNVDTATGVVTGTDKGATTGGLGVARTVPPVVCIADGPVLNTSTTPTSILLAAAKAIVPATHMVVGKVWRITARGRLSNMNPTPGNITLDVRFGNVVIFNGGAVALNAAAKTNVTFTLDITLTLRATGSGTSANVMGVGTLASEAVVGGTAGTAIVATLPASAPAVGTGFDSTVDQTVDLFATFSVSNAANGIQVHEYSIEPVN